jgi:hypothetical protein
MKEMKVRGYGWWTSYTDTHVQETFLTPKRHDQRRTSPHHSTIKMPRLENKERILNAARGKHQHTYKCKHIRITSDLSAKPCNLGKHVKMYFKT